jgi:histidyl-tRNA synthetase
LVALAEQCGGIDKLSLISVAIDKLDKIGAEKVKAELLNAGLEAKQVAIVEQYLAIAGTNEEKMIAIQSLLGDRSSAAKGIEEISYLLKNTAEGAQPYIFDPTLARGLNYYTGIIYEVKALNVQMGSIGGGGRYDDLTGLFGVPGIPGVGISFGVDRIYDVLEELNAFPAGVHTGTRLLFFNLGESEAATAFRYMQQLRNSGIACELFHEASKFDKQFKYAEKKNVPFVAIIGEKELASNSIVVKELKSGEQKELSAEEFLKMEFR